LNISWLDDIAIIISYVDGRNMALNLLPILSTFAIVAIAEFGDKTQIGVVSLSAKHRPRSVFIGALLAYALVGGVSALIGGAIVPYFSAFWIDLVAGVSFLIFGAYTLFSKENAMVKIKEHSKTVTTSFLLIAVLEFGDKTQLAIITLSAEYGARFCKNLNNGLSAFNFGSKCDFMLDRKKPMFSATILFGLEMQ